MTITLSLRSYSIELKIMSGEAVHTAEVLYRHDLTANNSGESFTAYNMCCGTFGGSERDSICVQSMDGKLQLLEGNSCAFCRRLVTCLVPGPLCYVPRLEAFVTCNSACEVECYRYQALAAAADMRKEEAAEVDDKRPDEAAGGGMGGGRMGGGGGGGARRRGSISAGKRIRADWTRQVSCCRPKINI